jgi:hypothetical protein
VLSVIDNQIVRLSSDSNYYRSKSGCRVIPTTTIRDQTSATPSKPTTKSAHHKTNEDVDSTYFDKFLKSTTEMSPSSTTSDGDYYSSTTLSENSTDVDFENFNLTDSEYKVLTYDQNSQDNNLENTTDYRAEVEEMFEGMSESNNNRTKRQAWGNDNANVQTLLVTCHVRQKLWSN